MSKIENWSKLTKNQLNIKLIEGCNYANILQVKEALKWGANINCRRAFDYMTALHIAAEHGNVNLVRLLCDQPNVKIESKTMLGLTALHTATLLGHAEVVIELLKRGVNPNCKDNLSRYPLHYASLRGNAQMARILINRKASINVFDVFQESPLHQSVLKRPNIDIIKLLLKHGAEVMETPNGVALGLFFEAILCAHREIDIDVLNIFFKHGININAKDPIGWRTPLHLVAITGYENLAKFLLKNGADPYLKNRAGLIPYEVACRYRNLKVLLLLEGISIPKITNENEM